MSASAVPQRGPAAARQAVRRELAGVFTHLSCFAGLPKTSVDRLAAEIRIRHYAAGEIVFREGEPAREFCVLTAGELELRVSGGDPESPPVAVIKAPNWFGEIALLTGQPRTATVVACSDATIGHLSRPRFTAALDRHPVIARNLLRNISKAIQRKDQDFLGQSALALHNARLLDTVREQSRQLATASLRKSQFLASMSHEIRTPLNAIMGFSDVLLDSSMVVSEADRAQFLTDIRESGKHLLHLINEVLDLAKIEAGRMELRRAPAVLADVLDTLQSTLRPLAMKKSIQFTVEAGEDIPMFSFDVLRIKQVLMNLVGNAIKFTPEGGRVWVHARRENGAVRIEVGDNGPGIAIEDQERIFQEFQRVENPSRTATPEGTGLGLTLARQFMELHGGTLWVKSSLGQGSRFYVRLPITDAALLAQTNGPTGNRS